MAGKWSIWLAILLAVATCRAEIVATARSSRGEFPEFRLVLDAVEQPVAVANFMGLVDGSQRWVDPVTGTERGGAGDAFYDGMVFDWQQNNVIRGGSHGVPGTDGGMEYTGGPGYTVLGKTNEAWSAYGIGTLVLVEDTGPHSGGSEIALYLTNGVTPWTPFGRLVDGDEAGLRALADRVAEGVVDAEWEIDAGRATVEEMAALKAAQATLPVPGGLAARLSEGAAGPAFDWPPRTRLVIAGCGDLLIGPKWLGAGWHEREESLAVDFTWNDLGLDGDKGFIGLTGVRYPTWSGRVFEGGKWRMDMEHTGKRLQYWFDFDAKTGMVAVVENGEITSRVAFSQVTSWRETGNCIGIYYGQGLTGNFYYLGFADANTSSGRFMSKQLSIFGETSRDWGMFAITEGWEQQEATCGLSLTSRSMASMPIFDCYWVPWGDGKGGWLEGDFRLPGSAVQQRR